MRPERALTVASEAFLFLAGRESDFGRLLAASGLAPAEVRARAADPEFLGFVLDFVLSEEPLARAFAEAEGLAPEEAMAARARLPGGDAPHWT